MLVDLDEGVLLLDGLEVGVRADGRLRGDDAHRAAPRRQRGRCRARPHDAQDGQRVATAQERQRDGGGRVAGHDDGLDVARRQLVEALGAEADDLVVGPGPVRGARVVAEVERVLARQASHDLDEDGEPADPRVEETDGSGVAHPGQVSDGASGAAARTGAASGGAMSRCAMAMISWLALALGCARTKGTPSAEVALTSGGSSGMATSGQAAQLGGHLLGLDARAPGPVHDQHHLVGRHAGRHEGLPGQAGVADRVAIRRHDAEDAVGVIEVGERRVRDGRRRVDDDDVVDATQERDDLLDVACRDHLGLLDTRRREQQVDARGVAPEDRGEVALGDAVGGQLEDGGRRVRHAQEAAQVAELEVAVDEHDADAGLCPKRDGQVVGDRRAAHAALAGVDDEGARHGAGCRGAVARVRVRQGVHELVAREGHREDLDDAHALPHLHRLLRAR